MLTEDKSLGLIGPWGSLWIANVIITFNQNNAETLDPLSISVEILRAGVGTKERLILEKISPQEWKHGGVIELTDDLVFIIKWDESEHCGRIHFADIEIQHLRLRESGQLDKRVNETFVIEGSGPELNLTFDIIPVLLDENTIPDSDLESEAQREGRLEDIMKEISYRQKIVQITPEGYETLPMHLNNLGKSYRSRFKLTRKLADISEAISLGERAVHLTPGGNAALPIYLTNLGIWYKSRFQCTGVMVDLSTAISSKQKAVDLTPEGNTATPMKLIDLADLYRQRFERTGNKADISEAISCQYKGIHLIPEGDLNMPAQLHTLGKLCAYRFECTGNAVDISEAIAFVQKCIQITPVGDSNMHKRLEKLGEFYYFRFEKTNDLADLLEAISFREKAIEITPNGYLDTPTMLYNIGYSYDKLFQHTGQRCDLDKAATNYSMAITRSSGIPSFKLQANKRLAKISQELYPSQAIDAYSTAIQLASHLAGLHATIEMRLSNLRHISDISGLAAAYAFKVGNINLALEWLEQGRCVVWGQINDLRAPTDVIRAKHPDLADEILKVSSQLELSGSQTTDREARVELAQEWDQLLTRVRALPDFGDFVQPLSYLTISEYLPKSGPIILINVHKDRCDALALVPDTIQPIHIPLPEFSHRKALALRNHLQANLLAFGIRVRGVEPLIRGMRPARTYSLVDILSQLWLLVVKPILEALGYVEPPTKLKRIWWCATGPLAFLPIHAAGIYSKPDAGVGSTLSDFAISSYTPTIRVLFERMKAGRVIDKERLGLFMVSQPDTPGLSSIPNTTDEVQVIQGLMKERVERVCCLEGAVATVDRTTVEMEAYSSVHFACHASQDTNHPLKSGFALHDGRLELSSIIQKRLVGGDLAFLSACQTSTGDETLSEEAVHLAGGLLAAGFRGVVATMWSIRDCYAPEFSKHFYANITEGSDSFSGENAAYALHHATQNLRRKLAVDKLDLESSLLTWVPYVHFGL